MKKNIDSDSLSDDKKKSRKKKPEIPASGIGLFDHIKQIKYIQNPDYFKNLTAVDLKSFNHFMILKSLSMNPDLLDDISSLFKYFDKIPSPQFYQLLIGLIPSDKKFYPWIKSKKRMYNKSLIELVVKYFEISENESIEYINLLFSTDGGKFELEELCRDFGMNQKQIVEMMKGNDDE